MNLRDTIDSSWSLNGDIRGRVTWRRRTKCTNSAGAKETKVVCLCHLNYVVIAFYIDLGEVHSQFNITIGLVNSVIHSWFSL